MAFTSSPVDHEVLGEERCDNHSIAVVQPSVVSDLAHGGVDNGEAGFAFNPAIVELCVVLPFYVGVFGFEAFIHAVFELVPVRTQEKPSSRRVKKAKRLTP